MAGVLYVVATPLGNVEDCSPRAKQILGQVDSILAEDTRRAGALFARLGLKNKNAFISFHEHNEQERLPNIIKKLEQGLDIAIISDAGTPLIADPGYRLVAEARKAGLRIVPVPGPCALITALSASGLPPYPFSFLGFLPRKEGQIKKILAQYKELKHTLVFFERKTRLSQTLDLCFSVLGNRPFCIARELTKNFEEFVLGQLDALHEANMEFKGEITLIIGPPEEQYTDSLKQVQTILTKELSLGGKPKAIAQRVAKKVHGFTSKQIYELMQELQ